MFATGERSLTAIIHYVIGNLVEIACFAVIVVVALLWFLIPGGASARESDLFLRGL